MASEERPSITEELKEKFLRGLWRRFTHRSLVSKVLLVLIVLAIVFVLARLQLIGETFHRATRVLVPWHLSWFDSPRTVIPLRLSYEVEDSLGRRPGKSGDAVSSGTTVILTFRADSEAWLTVFGVDSKGVHPIFGDGLDPLWIEPEKPYAREFELDDTLGTEVYYAVAGTESFEFQAAIEPKLPSILPTQGGRGPADSPVELELPSGFTVKWIEFQHVAAIP